MRVPHPLQHPPHTHTHQTPLLLLRNTHSSPRVPQTAKAKTQLRQRNRRRRPWLSASLRPPPSPIPNPYGQTFSSRLSSSARRPVFVGDFAVRGFQLLRRRRPAVSRRFRAKKLLKQATLLNRVVLAFVGENRVLQVYSSAPWIVQQRLQKEHRCVPS